MPLAGWPVHSPALPVHVDHLGPDPCCTTLRARWGVPNGGGLRSLARPPAANPPRCGGDAASRSAVGPVRAATGTETTAPPVREGVGGGERSISPLLRRVAALTTIPCSRKHRAILSVFRVSGRYCGECGCMSPVTVQQGPSNYLTRRRSSLTQASGMRLSAASEVRIEELRPACVPAQAGC